jgi:hypothetical protein
MTTTAPTVQRAIALLALQIAEGYAAAGTHEEGGNNRGDQVEFFQHLMGGAPGDSWCADFVCSCFVKGFARHFGKPEDRASLPSYVHQVGALMVPLSGSCNDLMLAARAKGILHTRDFNPFPGDIVLYDMPPDNALGHPHHVGIVRSWPEVVEGNTSSGIAGSQGDGDGVFLRTRSRADVFGFIHFS